MTVPTPDAFVPDPHRWKILAVLLVTIFMSLISVSIVNVALPSIQHGIGASESQIQWVLSGYALTFGVVLVAAGRAGDVYGRGVLFITGVVIFTLSSVAAGLAPTPLALDGARFLQGIGSGLLNPQGIGMIQQYFRGAERGKAFGLFGSTVGLSVAAGPIIGGLLIAAGGPTYGWRLTFFVNVPIGLLAIALAVAWFPRPLLVRNSHRREHGTVNPGLDPVGAVLLGLAVLSILLPFAEGRTHPWTWSLLVLGAVLFVAWVFWERHYRERGNSPMVDLSIFRTRSFTNGTALILLYFLGFTSIFVLIALYLQNGLGHTALETGLIGLPSALMTMITAAWSGRHVLRLGRKIVIAGMISTLLALGLSVAVIMLRDQGLVSEWWLLLTLAFAGIGQGLVISPNQTLTLEAVPLQYAGSSGGIMQTGQRIGTSVGVTVITTIAFAVLATSNWAQATSIGFTAIAVVIVFSLAIAVHDLRVRSRTPQSADPSLKHHI